MPDLYAVIGGSGLYGLDDGFRLEQSLTPDTPYGKPSAPLVTGWWQDKRVVFLARHGQSHSVAPHLINYRANLWALHQAGVSHIIAVNAVGGITAELAPQTIALPDQIIDYSSGREQSFLDGGHLALDHIDFTFPYSQEIRANLIKAAKAQGIHLIDTGTYGCTNGPRLETKAEVVKLKQDGCTMVGMTGMPEAALARELKIEYASIALVVNWCAGIDDSIVSMDEIKLALTQGMDTVKKLICATLAQVS